jgi:PAS domain S-box-containing protein
VTGHPRPWRVVVPVTIVLVGVDLYAAFVSRNSDRPVLWGVLTAFAGLAFVGTGLVAWSRRPGNGTGRLLVLGGLSWLFFAPLWTANDSLLYTSGNAFGSIPIAILLLIVALYPVGRPTSAMERILTLVVFPVAILSGLLPTLFEGNFTFGCDGCPPNRFLIADDRHVYDVLQAAFGLVGLVFFLGVCVLAVRRWRAATPAMRRVLRPVYLTGGVSVAAIGVGFAAGEVSETAGGLFWVVALVGVLLLPFALLAGLLQTSLMLGVRRLLDYADDPASEGAQDAVRRALGDPTARLGLWAEQGYVDLWGNPFPLLTDEEGRAYARIDGDHGPLGFIEHDAAIDVHAPEILAEVVTACRIALEKDRGRRALERSQARLRALLDAMPDLMIRFRRDGTYVDIRGDVKGLVRPPEQMIGRNVRDFLPGDVVDELMDCAAAALGTGTTQTAEYELELNGEVRTFEARMVPSSDDEIVSIVREITLSRRLERELGVRLQELQHEQTFTRTVVNTAPIVLMLCDDAGGIIRFNDTTERLTGRVDDEHVWGLKFWDLFVHPDDAAEVAAVFGRVEPGRELEEVECRWLTSDGEELILACTFNAIVDGQGISRRIIAGLDVTERERGRQELVRQRDLLGVVSRATPNVLFVAEPDGAIAWEGVNPAFAEMTGEDDETANGRLFWELVVAPDDVEAVRGEFAAAVASGEVGFFSAALDTRTGERRLMDWSCRPLTGLDSRTKYLLCGVDVTERERHLQEIRASRARLVEAQDAERRRLERNLHDGAQQRLVSLSLALRLAQAKLSADPEGAGDILAAANDELALALAELRELARGIHPAMLTDRGLEAAVESLATRAPVPVELAAMPRERLPAPVEAAAFYVISEALANVGKYAHATLARVSVMRVDGHAVVVVDDDGVGGADPTSGSGLRGLVDRIEALDGRLEVVSPEGGGTRIRAEIPCAR